MSNFNHSNIYDFKKDISYSENSVVSKRVLEKSTGNISLFAFDKGQQLSEHSAPFDAMVQCVEGKVEITIDKKPYILYEGQTIIMPAGIPHAVVALEPFKMLLTMIKGSDK
ncbi:MAG: cupin domain-containing protein [Bacteroidota bacterium]